MTEAEKAHLRLMETIPTERISTHRCADKPEMGERPSLEVSRWRRRFIKENHEKMTQRQIAEELGISQGAVSEHMSRLGLSKLGRGRPRKDKR